jgi:DNA-directed RNA polymerase subunit K/omega
MKARVESRSSQIDNECCVEIAGNRYDLIVAASQRLREMKIRARETGKYVTAIDALLEVQAEQINVVEYLVKAK